MLSFFLFLLYLVDRICFNFKEKKNWVLCWLSVNKRENMEEMPTHKLQRAFKHYHSKFTLPLSPHIPLGLVQIYSCILAVIFGLFFFLCHMLGSENHMFAISKCMDEIT